MTAELPEHARTQGLHLDRDVCSHFPLIPITDVSIYSGQWSHHQVIYISFMHVHVRLGYDMWVSVSSVQNGPTESSARRKDSIQARETWLCPSHFDIYSVFTWWWHQRKGLKVGEQHKGFVDWYEGCSYENIQTNCAVLKYVSHILSQRNANRTGVPLTAAKHFNKIQMGIKTVLENQTFVVGCRPQWRSKGTFGLFMSFSVLQNRFLLNTTLEECLHTIHCMLYN